MHKNLYCLIGPSGSGKTTVADVLSDIAGMIPVESYTTRPARFEGEQGHTFVSQEEFRNLGEMVAYTLFNGFEYGITKEMLDKCDLYTVDVAGYRMLKEKYPERNVYGFVLSASPETCAKRMAARGDSEDKIASRLEHDEKAFVGMTSLPDVIVLDAGNMTVAQVAKTILDEIVRLEKGEQAMNKDIAEEFGSVTTVAGYSGQLIAAVCDKNDRFIHENSIPHRDTEYGWTIYAKLMLDTAPEDEEEDLIRFITISDNLMHLMGMTEDELIDEAIRNSQYALPVYISSLPGMLMLGGVDVGDYRQETSDVIVVTNTKGAHGASAILYDGVLEHQYEQIRENFFVLPSSLHEVLLVPESLQDDAKVLHDMVKGVNASVVKPEDILNDTILYYDGTAKELRLA